MEKVERKSMKKYILNYTHEIDEKIATKKPIDVNQHLIKINMFNVERHIHLLVTITTLILTIFSFIIGYVFSSAIVLVIGYMIMCFLIPYIYHYFLLENCVQKMYRQYDLIIKSTK